MKSLPADAPGRAQTVTGQVTGAGVPVTSVGFTVTRTGAGTYVVRITPPVRALQAVTAVAMSAALFICTTGAFTAEGAFNVWAWNSAGVATDTSFGFTAAVMR